MKKDLQFRENVFHRHPLISHGTGIKGERIHERKWRAREPFTLNPGGTGAMTVVGRTQNVIDAARYQLGHPA